jgi:hypothetical protein
LRVAR